MRRLMIELTGDHLLPELREPREVEFDGLAYPFENANTLEWTTRQRRWWQFLRRHKSCRIVGVRLIGAEEPIEAPLVWPVDKFHPGDTFKFPPGNLDLRLRA